MSERKNVLLVNEEDEIQGIEDKLIAHQAPSQRHRAFSIFLFNKNNELLLQKRASHKYHAANLWSNTCCSHPQLGEDTLDSAKLRLLEELGIEAELKFLKKVEYKSHITADLYEWEIDHLFTGIFEGKIYLNPEEVSEVTWINLDDLASELINNPSAYTPWLHILLPFIANRN